MYQQGPTINQTSQTMRRLKQTICYITTFWRSSPIHLQNSNNYSQLLLMTTQTHLSKQKGLSLAHHNNHNVSPYTIIANHMYFTMSINKNQQVIKLKNVDNFLQSIDTNLVQVIQELQYIYDKIRQYEHIQHIHHKYKQEKVHHAYINQQYKFTIDMMQEERYDIQAFHNIFKFINGFLFKDSFRDVLQKSAKQLAVWLLEIQTKLSILPELIQSASKFTTDITTCQPHTDRYGHAWKNIEIVQMDQHAQKVGRQINLLKKMIKITTSAVVAQNSTIQMTIVKKIAFGLSFPYYWLADIQSQLQCYKIWRKPKIEVLNLVWNMPENGAISKLKSIIFPYIKTSFFIYIPTKIQPKQKYKISKLLYEENINIFQRPQNQQAIRVLVLYDRKLTFRSDIQEYDPISCCSCLDNIQQDQIDTILIHIHGGGFVALSSQTSQTYTRKWANQLKIPVFSIDYRKPPNYRFPIPLEDCLTVYQFIVQNIHKYFKIKPKNIVIAGDSAGGNLAVALEALLLKNKYPVMPIGIFLAYPAVDLRIKYSPSRLHSFDDPILLPPLLLLCLKEYLGENPQNQSNPLASPLLLTENFIKTGQNWNKKMSEQLGKWPKQWPSTKIMVGKKDPLFDDSLRLIQRMTCSGIDAKLIIYNQLSHAFLSLDNVIGFCSLAIEDSIKQLKKLFNI